MDGAECAHQQFDGLRRSGRYRQRAMVSRRDKHCLCASGAEVAEPSQRATELARRRGLQGHRGRPWGHQPWPGGGWRRPRPACEKRASILHIHVRYTHTTSHYTSMSEMESADLLLCPRSCFDNRPTGRRVKRGVTCAYNKHVRLSCRLWRRVSYISYNAREPRGNNPPRPGAKKPRSKIKLQTK